MKNKVLWGILLFVLVIPLVVADNNDSIDNVQRAYNCLESKISNRTDLSLEEAVFSVLALGYKDNVFGSIDRNKKSDEECWPKNGCKLKESAQVALAYNRVDKNTDELVRWISSKNATSTELTWYLEIDSTNHVPTSCKIKYDGQEKSVQIKSDMKLEGNPGNCFDIASGGYWLRINNNCLNKEFSISCDQDFITTLIYQKAGGGAIYLSSQTNSAPSLGSTKEKVNAKCFKTSGGCDYEGSLWATLALQKLGRDVSEFVPYLLALAEDNERYFPSAFLYSLTSGEDQYGKIIQSQKQNKYWQQTGTPYNRFYDTSLAMLALKSNAPTEFSMAQEYLLSIQTSEGCWNNNNIRDSAFVLYSGWEKDVLPYLGTYGGAGGVVSCELPKSCEIASACIDAGGEVLSVYDCPSILEVCCSKVVPKFSCNELGGVVCSSGQQCSGEVVSSGDGACCKGACQNVAQDMCEKFKVGVCRDSCYKDEEEKSESCEATGGVCCAPEPEESGTGLWTWIFVLIVLIALVVLGIVFRKQLQLWWLKIKSIKKPSKPSDAFSGMQARGAPMRTGGVNVPGRSGFVPRMQGGRDKIMDDTIRKLKEMSE